MKEADKISEKHTFVLVTDYVSELSVSMGLFFQDELFNVPYPQDLKTLNQVELEDKVLLKTIYSGTVEFYNRKI